ncbi:hypothetical protein [Gallaecimonas pentaromativorans]|uniref:hypothetical protein n=1 Tax=Gallaecimonas pentaromativorans TaxID=584787 RepID=UPI0012ECD16B|nr:hypothetical protein [Gallaecimonas pentaromativorans]MED5524888.1 hypothetical protein [Pseudomonadota bacterium]
MKNGFILLAIFISSKSFACFSDIGYEQNWDYAIQLLLLTLGISFVSIAFRVARKVKRCSIPIIIFIIFSLPSLIEIFRYGSGDCGIMLKEASVWPIYASIIVVTYEVIFYITKK